MTGHDCGFGRGCGSRVVRLVLDPDGEARFPVEVTTDVRVMDAECEAHPGAPLGSGEYELTVNVLFLREPLHSVLRVP